MENKIKVSLHNVGRTFLSAQGERIEALHDVNFEVEDAYSAEGRDVGEFRVLLGPSGCGKSTILRLIAGLDFPDKGQVLVNGKHVAGPGRDRGMVFQKYTLFPWLTVAENIAYGMKVNGFPPAERQQALKHSSRRSGSRASKRPIPIRSPAECSSGWLLRAPWPCGRKLSSWTSRLEHWMPRPAATCSTCY